MKARSQEGFMERCFELARLGAGKVSPNPMVGAVIVSQGRIIGEGYHKVYGGPHAEVNAVSSVPAADRHLLPASTLYVSLEPCSIHGNTPPCTDLILREAIPRVVTSTQDPTKGVDGRGLQLLREGGHSVTDGINETEGRRVSAIRDTFIRLGRPYIILKYACSRDGYLGRSDGQVWLTNPFSKRLVHKWRSETDALLVGANTALTDNPELSTRYGWGRSPLRIVLDPKGRLPGSLKLFDDRQPTLVVGKKPSKAENFTQTRFWTPAPGSHLLSQLLPFLAEKRITSLMVEGGAHTLAHFLEHGLWDEARVFTAPRNLSDGIQAPRISQDPDLSLHLLGDRLDVYFRKPD